MNPFYGRERELGILKELLDSNVARLVVLQGRRRIGKSRLAEQFRNFFEQHLTFVISFLLGFLLKKVPIQSTELVTV